MKNTDLIAVGEREFKVGDLVVMVDASDYATVFVVVGGRVLVGQNIWMTWFGWMSYVLRLREVFALMLRANTKKS